ncbi:substrate-binding domain-containing protein [Oscillospiraceae bacterium CM]|nr:substrate-binding domain-containing protein [Oscillospiraceae bacterium CM]
MKKIIALALAALTAVTLLAGCNAGTPTSNNTTSPAAAGSITASGSTALQPLLTLAIDPFKAATKFDGSVTINGGGSGTGLTDVAAGTVNIGDSDVTPEQAGKDATGLVDHQVAVVAVGIAVSSDVAANLKSITKDDLTKIFTGAITDWNQVNGWTGGSLPVSVYYRKAGSGTRTLFETYGIGKKLSDADLGAFANFTKKESSGDLQTAITTGKGAIGYETLPYCKDLTLLQLDGVDATYDNVYTGKYVIWGFEHMYTKGEATGSVKAFIDYVMSADFAKTITDNGYGDVSKMTVSR